MKKTYNSPATLEMELHLENHLLVDSGDKGVTVDPNQSVSSNFSREQKSGGFGSGMWEDMK